jgi:hypothetical protein
MLQPLALQLGLDGCNIQCRKRRRIRWRCKCALFLFFSSEQSGRGCFHPRKVIVFLFILLTIPSWSIFVQRIQFMLQEGSHWASQKASCWQAVGFRDKMPSRSEDVVPCFDSTILSRGLPSPSITNP